MPLSKTQNPYGSPDVEHHAHLQRAAFCNISNIIFLSFENTFLKDFPLANVSHATGIFLFIPVD